MKHTFLPYYPLLKGPVCLNASCYFFMHCHLVSPSSPGSVQLTRVNPAHPSPASRIGSVPQPLRLLRLPLKLGAAPGAFGLVMWGSSDEWSVEIHSLCACVSRPAQRSVQGSSQSCSIRPSVPNFNGYHSTE